ncbi:Aste57867_3298 [Aphanomyces stellatus]|uniref:Aste57867_3298 protein n=1 Tax=Aphanomyces stellatus TaxID=120398 RepID=A0A485KA48_9STRA|nr:hypothetical protein As57867_003288 [Aphanomyces stellatus]VFT80468.1 Aste57867_3298 [Aphanomyces stellatus]
MQGVVRRRFAPYSLTRRLALTAILQATKVARITGVATTAVASLRGVLKSLQVLAVVADGGHKIIRQRRLWHLRRADIAACVGRSWDVASAVATMSAVVAVVLAINVRLVATSSSTCGAFSRVVHALLDVSCKTPLFGHKHLRTHRSGSLKAATGRIEVRIVNFRFGLSAIGSTAATSSFHSTPSSSIGHPHATRGSSTPSRRQWRPTWLLWWPRRLLAKTHRLFGPIHSLSPTSFVRRLLPFKLGGGMRHMFDAKLLARCPIGAV